MKMRGAHVVLLPRQTKQPLEKILQITGRGRYVFSVDITQGKNERSEHKLSYLRTGYGGKGTGHSFKYTLKQLTNKVFRSLH